ncbi:hypothetical protein [Aliiglaciecola sp. LCG003]|uniref:hypothetical protein n=1 Tax=Aliiglaciecola sp. LCG003 TaxID=3053655 RepID=UPI002572E3E0|nr:hypothetical protein [Aliiglaciecola sp. LCG003]WJG07945.1 hypothetical protein QR722_11280 [Aliiglaciecola sp. LCG003]
MFLNPLSSKAFVFITLIAIAFIACGSVFLYLNSAKPTNSFQVTEEIKSNLDLNQFSYQDILENPEFKQGMQRSVKTKNLNKAKALQQKAIQIALAAGLDDFEVQLLSGDKGLNFMQFLAKRQLFAAEFEVRYQGLKDIQQLKLDYPEAADLFARSDMLIAKRDRDIIDIAKSLATGNADLEPYIRAAQQQWLRNSQAKE